MDLIELKQRHKYRLLVEESISMGVLGPRGAGVSNYFDVPASSIDIIVSTLSNSFGASGGFCAGSKEIVEHQRLGGQSYVYSASLPAILAVTAVEHIKHLQANPHLTSSLAQNSEKMLGILEKAFEGQQVKVEGSLGSPIFHIRMQTPSENREDDERFLQEIVDLVFFNRVSP